MVYVFGALCVALLIVVVGTIKVNIADKLSEMEETIEDLTLLVSDISGAGEVE